MSRLLYVLVDAVRHDYVTEERTPYLASVAAKHGRSRMRPLLGYSDSIRAAIFTGAYPDETGYWMEYCLRPDETPLAHMSMLARGGRIYDGPDEVHRQVVAKRILKAFALGDPWQFT